MSEQKLPGPTREAAAHHEAAHAVIATICRTGRPVESVWIEQGQNASIVPGLPSWGGRMLSGGPESVWEYYRDHVPSEQRDEEAVVLAAGRAGHEHLLGEGLEPAVSSMWASEDDEYLDILKGWPLSAAPAEGYEMEDDEYALLLAAAPARGEEWLRAIHQRARSLVVERWDTIVQVARALLDSPEHRLSGDEVQALVSSVA